MDTNTDTDMNAAAPDSDAMVSPACKKCGGTTDGYKCDMCGVESHAHDSAHGCGAEHCMPKCGPCNEAEAKCAC
ncbi:MAG: hypothetical protein Q8R13_02405 [bacterium]|nr:hypothetical protein [bacterium]MDZ4295750.1 hypothetical protein [Patescibacteria group bacterium]